MLFGHGLLRSEPHGVVDQVGWGYLNVWVCGFNGEVVYKGSGQIGVRVFVCLISYVFEYFCNYIVLCLSSYV